MKAITITHEPWGCLASGGSVDLYTLSHSSGMAVKISNYGATLVELHVPLADGSSRDVVLGFDEVAGYEAHSAYFGSTVGRVAGRLTGSRYVDQDQVYQLTNNEGENHLHGGGNSIDRYLWDVEVLNDGLMLSCVDPAGNHGYPGTLRVSVCYRFTADGMGVKISYKATTDARTPLSLTNHSYFNLSGAGNDSGVNQLVQILADDYVPSASDGTLSDKVTPVLVGGNDLRSLVPLVDQIDAIDRQHGDHYMLRSKGGSDSLRQVARLESADGALFMDTLTTEPCMQFYTGRFIDEGLRGKKGGAYGAYAGLCFECHGYPNQPNASGFPSIILDAEDTYGQTTVYQFGF